VLIEASSKALFIIKLLVFIFRISENSNNKSPEFQQKKSNIFWEKGVNYESSLGSI
jgi:hypothetical protein